MAMNELGFHKSDFNLKLKKSDFHDQNIEEIKSYGLNNSELEATLVDVRFKHFMARQMFMIN